MRITPLHPWNVSREEAIGIQQRLRALISTEKDFEEVSTVAGVDVGFEGDMAKAAVVVLRYPDLTPLEQAGAHVPVTFPYIPGLLSFREAPSILAALEKLKTEPDLIIVDGQGIAHPRRFGIASHLGLLVDKPTIGCAKSRLVGVHHEPGPKVGSYAYLYDGQEIIGAVLRTKLKTSPVYVSIGHRIDLEAAIHYVLTCCRGYRLPEPIRLAHQVAGGAKLAIEGEQLSLF